MTEGASGWVEPNQGDRYLCDDGKVRTWAELTEDLGPDERPGGETDYELLLWSFGAERVSE